MEFITSNWRDISKYYENTYVKFSEYGERLFLITGVNPNSVTGIDEDDTAFELHLSDSHPYTVNYLLPHKATFQWGNEVYMLQRIPARQYRRGLCSDNTQIINVSDGRKRDIGFASLKAFTNKPTYMSFSEAFFAKGRTKALALSPRMTYIRTGDILIDMVRIAKFNYDTKKIELKNKLFLPEIMQHMLDYNETIEVQQ